MGGSGSKPLHSSNDFELVIKASKELEHLLETEFGGTGKGLHEKITSASPLLTPLLVRNMRYLAAIRNRLLHEMGFRAIPDREGFIVKYENSALELKQLIEKQSKGRRTDYSHGASDYSFDRDRVVRGDYGNGIESAITTFGQVVVIAALLAFGLRR